MATQQLGVAGLTKEARVWYEKILQDRNTPDWRHEQFGMQRSIPSRGGNNISIRQFTRPAAATTALVEGTPPAATNPTVGETIISVGQYGAYMLGSDVVQTQAIDPQLTEWTAVFKEMMSDTRDKIVRSAINTGTNVAYSNGATVRSGLASGSAYNLAWADLRNARKILKGADAPYFSDNKYFSIIHPDVVKNLFADTTVVNAFSYAGARTNENPLFRGELGDLQGIRFYESTNATTFSGLGQSAGFVYATLFGGKDGYVVTEYDAEGPGGSQIIFHDVGTSGVNDPLNQVWSLGFKTALGAGIIDQARLLRYESNG